RPRPTKLELCRELRRVVSERLQDDHSPEQIAGWLQLRYPDNEVMHVSHETIYRTRLSPTPSSQRSAGSRMRPSTTTTRARTTPRI
ncbi:MAG TPA: IS30 family transposase, partial [Thermoleophilaceae bacterium]|nr:IS30 family transposase [Thermoleophilaceae bacterium]